MIKKRMILKQLSHALDRLTNAIKAMLNRNYDLAENDIKISYSLIKQALEDERKRYRKNDGSKNIFKQRLLLQSVEIIKEDLKMLRVDIKHGNVKSACNWINNIRRTLKDVKYKEKNTLRNSDKKRG